MPEDNEINIFAIINPIPESLKRKAEDVEALVWERIRSRPPGSPFVPARSIQLIAITYLMIRYFYEATLRAEAAVLSINKLEAGGFVTGRHAVFTEGSEETIRGRKYAEELLDYIGESQIIGLIEEALSASMEVENFVDMLVMRAG